MTGVGSWVYDVWLLSCWGTSITKKWREFENSRPAVNQKITGCWTSHMQTYLRLLRSIGAIAVPTVPVAAILSMSGQHSIVSWSWTDTPCHHINVHHHLMIELWSAIQDKLQAVYVPCIYVDKGICTEVEVVLFSRLPLMESGIELKNWFSIRFTERFTLWLTPVKTRPTIAIGTSQLSEGSPSLMKILSKCMVNDMLPPLKNCAWITARCSHFGTAWSALEVPRIDNIMSDRN